MARGETPMDGHPLGEMLAQLESTQVAGARLGPPPTRPVDDDEDVPEMSFGATGQKIPWSQPEPAPRRADPVYSGLAYEARPSELVAARPQGFITIIAVDLTIDSVVTTAGTISLSRQEADKVRQVAVKAVRKAIEEDLGGRRKSVRRVRRSRKPAQGVQAGQAAVPSVRAEPVAAVEQPDGPVKAVPANRGGRKGRPRKQSRVSE